MGARVCVTSLKCQGTNRNETGSVLRYHKILSTHLIRIVVVCTSKLLAYSVCTLGPCIKSHKGKCLLLFVRVFPFHWKGSATRVRVSEVKKNCLVWIGGQPRTPEGTFCRRVCAPPLSSGSHSFDRNQVPFTLGDRETSRVTQRTCRFY